MKYIYMLTWLIIMMQHANTNINHCSLLLVESYSTIMKRLLDSLCDLNLLLNKKFQVPTFHVHSSNISVIKTPTDFYETLKVLISNFLLQKCLIKKKKIKSCGCCRWCWWCEHCWIRSWTIIFWWFCFICSSDYCCWNRLLMILFVIIILALE